MPSLVKIIMQESENIKNKPCKIMAFRKKSTMIFKGWIPVDEIVRRNHVIKLSRAIV